MTRLPTAFVVSMTSEDLKDEAKMEEFQQTMNAIAESNCLEIDRIAAEMKISTSCAADVWYLRTRSRWTEELEKELIRLHNIGQPPNINEFGCTSASAERIANEVEATYLAAKTEA